VHPRIQELIDHIASHRRDVYAAVATVPEQLRDQRPAPGRWSVAEVLEHLSLIERRVAALLSAQVTAARANNVGPDVETSSVVASFSNIERVTDRTNKIDSPEPVEPTGTLDAQASAHALAESRAVMLTALQHADGVALGELVQLHPVLGPLNMYHWIVALGLHDARHAAQIREAGEILGRS
jgi:uncharacterized damage-inducible protein DinB